MKFFVEYSIEKLNFTKLLNTFNREEIKIFSIKYTENTVTFCSKLSEKNNILAILNKSVYNNIGVTTISPKTIWEKNMFSFIGILIFLVIAYLPMVMVFDCRILCTDQELTKEIQVVLEDYQLDSWNTVSKEQENLLEKDIMKIEGVSFCEVSKKGGKLYLEVKGSLSPNVKEQKDCIIATKSGIITNMLVLSGTPLVAIGDYVEVGDVLIDGVVYSKEKDKFIKVNAEGSVLAESTLEIKENIYENGIVFSKTNETAIGREVSFFNKVLKNAKSPFEHSLQEKSTITVGVLPFTITTIKYTKCDYSFYESNFQVEEEICREKLMMQEIALASGGKIISREFVLEEFVGYKTITLKSLVEMKISDD